MIYLTALLLSTTLYSVESSAVDDEWMKYLESPPETASTRYEELAQRADELVSNASVSLLNGGGDVDVVISGGANFDAYYFGVAQIFSRV